MGCSPKAKSSTQNSTSMSELPKISQPSLRLPQVPAFHFSPFEFAPVNSLGVMDHDVTLESGVTVHNPMRVVPNGEGSEFVFTLIRRPGMTDAELARDRAAVERDLKTLKGLLERL